MVLRSETVSPNQVSDLLLGRRQKEKMIESLKTHFRLLVHARGEGEEECYWSCHGNSISGTPSSPHFPYLFIFLCSFPQEQKGEKKKRTFLWGIPRDAGGVCGGADPLWGSPLRCAELRDAHKTMFILGGFLNVGCRICSAWKGKRRGWMMLLSPRPSLPPPLWGPLWTWC